MKWNEISNPEFGDASHGNKTKSSKEYDIKI